MEEAVVDDIIKRLLEGGRGGAGKQVQLYEAEIRQLCTESKRIFLSQPNLLQLQAPINICGDLHGQYLDLLRIFERGGFPPRSNYVFLGDYVDRGKRSLETICLLLAYKVKYPENLFLLRGNHEDAKINRVYGFYDECKRRFNVRLWKIFTDSFNCLPVAALIDEKVLCMHGGLSPELDNLNQIEEIERPTEVPDGGLLCDLLWSDPDPKIEGWGLSDRGVSCTFGADKVAEFCDKHDLDLVCRAHQVSKSRATYPEFQHGSVSQLVYTNWEIDPCWKLEIHSIFLVVEDGYEFFADRRLVTIFSAPNYCGEFDNVGAFVSIDKNLMCSFQVLKPIDRKASTEGSSISKTVMKNKHSRFGSG